MSNIVSFEELKKQNPQFALLNEIEQKLPENLLPLLADRDGAAKFLNVLPSTFLPKEVTSPDNRQRCWELAGLFYFQQGRFYEALPIFIKLYEHMLLAQEEDGAWHHKGMPLFWVSECFKHLGFSVLAKRYMMLALCEDAVNGKGAIHPDTVGTYFQLVWFKGLSDSEIKKYVETIYEIYKDNTNESLFPEYILQKIDNRWLVEIPSPSEGSFYIINRFYVKKLIAKFGSSSGQELEMLAHYLLSCMPGCRTYYRQRSSSTDYDIVCSIEGLDVDFRSELGRYFVCECKDWKKKANFSAFAKYCRVLD